MTAEQIKLVRDFCNKDDGTGNHMAGRLAIVFNNEVCFVDTRDFIVWDDSNELVHCIRANSEDPVSQSLLPYRITTGMYDNCQYLEGLYDMNNFKKAIQEMFVDTGLINEEQKEEIMKWANGIRNIHPVPKAPGPYFKDTILPPPVPYTPEVRKDDGIYRAAPNNFISYQERIDRFITPAIERSTMKPVKMHNRLYRVDLDNKDSLATNIRTIIEAFPKNNIQRACFTDHIIESTPYSPKMNNMDKVVESIKTISKTIYDGERCTLLIDAFNTRCEYEFIFYRTVKEPANPNLVIKEIRNKINSFFDDFNSTCGSKIKRVGLSVEATIYNTNIDSDINAMIDFIKSVEGVQKITWSSGNKTIVTNIGDTEGIENLKKEVLRSMPDTNGATINGSVGAKTSTGASVVYRLRVKYYNQSECPAKIGDTYYTTLAEACANGGIVELVNDTTENVVIPAGKEVTLNLNGHTITADNNTAIENYGTLEINGTGTIDSNVPRKAALLNKGNCKVNTGVTLTRSNDTADTPVANTFYVIANYGDMEIADGVIVSAANQNSSLVTNGFYDTKNAGPYDKATMIIHGGNFTGGVINVKNDELGEMTVYGGTFGGAAGSNQAIQNWHMLTIEDGVFTTNISTGTYGKGVGHTVIKGGNFVNCKISKISNYPSDDINIYGGVFSAEKVDILKDYLASGYKFDVSGTEATVVKMDVFQQVDNIIANLPETKGLTITENPDEERSYDITTSNGIITNSTLIDQVAAIDGLNKIMVAVDGTDTVVEYVPGDDLVAFKDSVDALVPKSNTDPEVVLVMTVE